MRPKPPVVPKAWVLFNLQMQGHHPSRNTSLQGFDGISRHILLTDMDTSLPVNTQKHIDQHRNQSQKHMLQSLEVFQWISYRYLENINTHSIMSLAFKAGVQNIPISQENP
jgi:hypothetical protein